MNSASGISGISKSAPVSPVSIASVMTVRSINQPIVSASFSQVESGLSDTTDGEGTIQRAFTGLEDTTGSVGTVGKAFDNYAGPKSPPTIEVHQPEDAQGGLDAFASSHMDVDWEATLTASDHEDMLITPGQKSPIKISISTSQTEANEIESQDRKRKELQASSDEDNSIVMQFGSFVNSFLGSSVNKDSKKKVKINDLQTL